MADALLSLCQAIKSKSPITYSTADGTPTPTLGTATHLNIPPSAQPFPKSTPTRIRKPGSKASDPESEPSDFFSLDAVYLAWLLKDVSGAEYMKQARESGLSVGFVSVTERKVLVDWLEGKTTVYAQVIPLAGDHPQTPPGTPPQNRENGGTAVPSTSTQSPTKRRYVVDVADAEVVKKIKQNEIELRDRNTILRGFKTNNFSAIRDMYAEKLKRLKDVKGGSTASTPDPKLQARKPRNLYPIIMIPSSPTSLITMYNVKKFLQDSTFEPTTSARERLAAEGTSRPEDLIAIYRKRTHIDPSGHEHETQARYFVVDGVDALAKFGADAWDRVVCVLTTGQAWQFRPYKWAEPRTLFHHVKGFYVCWSNDQPNPKIKDWNVTELRVDPHRRHVDKSVVAHFWKTLDTWTMSNKPWLMKS